MSFIYWLEGLLRLAIHHIHLNRIAGEAGLMHHAVNAEAAVADEDEGGGPDEVHGKPKKAATQDHFVVTGFAMSLMPHLDIGVFDPSSASGAGHAIVHDGSLGRKRVGSQIKSGVRSQKPGARIIREVLSGGVCSGKTAGNSINCIVSRRQSTRTS